MFVRTTALILRPFLRLLNALTPIGDLIARVWVAQIFLLDGWVKFQSWNNTVQLFDSAVTAGCVIAAEFILPLFLILGLGGRIMIFLFFIFNGFMMYFYNVIWTPEGGASFNQQMAWAMLLMLLMLHGSGKMSLDHWLHKRHGHHLHPEK